jgi:thiopurine S-methyltransferase
MRKTDNKRWLKAWENAHIYDFHQAITNSLLIDIWPAIDLPKGQSIFVPLCGKSLDMLWLADQGYNVIGIELSPIAVEDFFKENNLAVIQSAIAGFTLWQSGPIRVLCGDFYMLETAHLGWIDFIYDRASLTALPQHQRARYVEKIKSLSNAPILLLTIEDDEETCENPDLQTIDLEIQDLYGPNHHIDLSMCKKITLINEDIQLIQKAYVIHPHIKD